MFIGQFSLDEGGLAWARQQAQEAQHRIREARRDDGLDPVAVKRAKRQAAKAALEPAKPARDLVDRVVEDYLRAMAAHRKDPETERIMRKEIIGRWAGRGLNTITSAEVREALREIAARGAPVGANRVLGKIKRLMNWAIEQEIITTSPVDKVKAMTPEKGRARERVLDDAELACVWRAAGTLGFPFGPITQLLILTGQRRGEVAGAIWTEIDLEKKVWTIPAARSKNGLSHAVPLTEPMVAILKFLPRFKRANGATDFVFSPDTTAPSGFSRAKRRLDDAVLKSLRAVDDEAVALPEWVVHDIRRSVATGMQRLGVKLEVIEKCLNHVGGSFSGIVSTYQRHAFSEEKRVALKLWSNHIEAILSGDAKLPREDAPEAGALEAENARLREEVARLGDELARRQVTLKLSTK